MTSESLQTISIGISMIALVVNVWIVYRIFKE